LKDSAKYTWATHRFAYISFAICFVEMAIFLSLAILAHMPGDHETVVKKVSAFTYLLGIPGSLVFAIVGLFADARRMTALIALIVALACSYLWTLQVLV
jgi:low temperature requirement protein LtrA